MENNNTNPGFVIYFNHILCKGFYVMGNEQGFYPPYYRYHEGTCNDEEVAQWLLKTITNDVLSYTARLASKYEDYIPYEYEICMKKEMQRYADVKRAEEEKFIDDLYNVLMDDAV